MKNLTEYISEHIDNEELDNQTIENKVNEDEDVWVVKDKDLEGAILDVCTTEEDAQKAYDEHMAENEDNHLEIVTCKRSEVEKQED